MGEGDEQLFFADQINLSASTERLGKRERGRVGGVIILLNKAELNKTILGVDLFESVFKTIDYKAILADG